MPYVPSASFGSQALTRSLIQQGTFSEKDDQLRQILAKLDAIDSDAAVATLSHEDIVSLRRRIADSQALIRETVDRLRQVQEENEMHQRRRDELESRISALETEYEELLGSFLFYFIIPRLGSPFTFYPLPQRRPSMMRKSAM